ncbi:DUF2490 domain-containing protein [Candidatus Neomarinimicrobiota bacterium]
MKLSGSVPCSWRAGLVLALILSLCTLAQGASPPGQVWSSVVISRTSARGIKTELEQQLRSHLESPVFKETFYELRLSYPLQMGFGVTLFYRQVFYPDNTAWRLAVAPRLNAPFGLEGLKLRLKFQRHTRHGEDASYHARFRGTFAFPLNNPCTLFVQAEPWWALEDPATFSRYRLDAGVRIKQSGGLGYEIYYRFQGDHNREDWQATDIISLKLKAAL